MVTRLLAETTKVKTIFAAFRSGPGPKYSRARAFWFLSVHNHGFCGGANTFWQEKYPFLS